MNLENIAMITEVVSMVYSSQIYNWIYRFTMRVYLDLKCQADLLPVIAIQLDEQITALASRWLAENKWYGFSFLKVPE